MPSMLPVSSACPDIRRRGEFIEHLLDASALGCASCVRFAPHIGHSGCRYAILKAAIRYLPRPTPAEEKDNGIF